MDLFILFITITYLIVLFGFRDVSSTPDTGHYVRIIGEINNSNPKFEYLSNYMFKLLNLLSDSYTIWLLILSVFPIFILLLAASKMMNINEISLLFVMIMCSFTYFDLASNVMRQFIGISFFIYALSFDYNNKTSIRNFLFLVAPLWHTSIIIMIMTFFISSYFTTNRSKVIDYFLLIIVSILSIAAISGVDLVVYVESSLLFITTLFNMERATYVLGVYSNIDDGSFYVKSTINKIIEVSCVLVPCFILLFEKRDKVIKILYVFIITTCIYLLIAYQAWSLRFSYFPLSLAPFIWVIYISGLKNIRNKIFITYSYISLSFLLFWYQLRNLNFFTLDIF